MGISDITSKTSKEKLLPFRENKTLTVYNQNNTLVNQFYEMHSPFMVTYEFCSGIEEDDYINFATLSEKDQTIAQEPFTSHEEYFRLHPPHFHDYFELLIVLEGSVTQRIENREYRYDAGTCCLITRSLCHFETFGSSAKLIFIGMSAEFLREMFEAALHSETPEEAQIINGPIYEFIMNDIKSPGQKAYLDFIPSTQNTYGLGELGKWSKDMIMALLNPHFGTHFLSMGCISSIIGMLSSPEMYHCSLTSLDESSDFLIFSRVEHILQENHGRVSRNELSKQLNYSGDYINRIVNKYTGMCLSDYGMKFCLQQATILLKTTDAPISTIATDLGFTNRTFFYKVFDEAFGMTPKEYRAINKVKKK